MPLPVGFSSPAFARRPGLLGEDDNVVRQPALAPKSRFERSPLVDATLKKLEQSARRGVAASAVIHAANGILEKYNFNYHTGLAKEANLKTPPPNGVLNLTVCMNVSGHTGQGQKYAQDPKQTFNVQVRFPDGRTETMRGIQKRNPASEEWAVAQDIQIPVTQKGTYTIDAWPDGSGGAGGYIEGRRYKLHVGEENFFKPNAQTTDERKAFHEA